MLSSGVRPHPLTDQLGLRAASRSESAARRQPSQTSARSTFGTSAAAIVAAHAELVVIGLRPHDVFTGTRSLSNAERERPALNGSPGRGDAHQAEVSVAVPTEGDAWLEPC